MRRFISTAVLLSIIAFGVTFSFSVSAKSIFDFLPFGKKDEACVQVITQAQNPKTGEVREFPNPCIVPKGWQIIQGPGSPTIISPTPSLSPTPSASPTPTPRPRGNAVCKEVLKAAEKAYAVAKKKARNNFLVATRKAINDFQTAYKLAREQKSNEAKKAARDAYQVARKAAEDKYVADKKTAKDTWEAARKIYNLCVRARPTVTPTQQNQCEIGKIYENTAVSPISCSCPDGYRFETIKMSWGPCPAAGMRDCIATELRCVAKAVTPTPTVAPTPMPSQ